MTTTALRANDVKSFFPFPLPVGSSPRAGLSASVAVLVRVVPHTADDHHPDERAEDEEHGEDALEDEHPRAAGNEPGLCEESSQTV